MRRFRKPLRLAFAPLRALWYRWLWGRRLPGAAALGRLVERLEAATGQGDVPLTRGAWEQQYRGGDWEFLTAQGERPRYRALAELLDPHLAAGGGGVGGAVLDVGCGEGLLALALAPGGLRRYVGVDLSEAAVAAARRRLAALPAELAVADAETFDPAGSYRAIVFNECLYYFRQPLEVVARYRRRLEPGGLVLISMFATPRSRAIARRLTAVHPAIERRAVPHPGGAGSWLLLALRAPSPGT